MAETLRTDFQAPVYDGVSSQFVGLSSSSAKRSPTGQHPCQGLYWTRTGASPSTAVMLVHYNADFMEHYLAAPLAARGFGVLGFNTRFRGVEDMFILEQALDDIAVGVQWLRDVGQAKRVVFIGNSGGGSLLSAYQARAQQESALAPADAFIFLNAHPGRPDVLTNWLDPSVTDESDPTKTDPTLDIFNPANKPPYTPEFVNRYRAAQRERNDRITEWAKQELKRLNAAGIADRNFPLYRTMADPRFLDATLEPTERPVPACYSGDPAVANRSVSLLGRSNTLKTWLSMWSLKESRCRLEPYTAQFKVPTIVIQGNADLGVYPSDARRIFESVGSPDKELRHVSGSHFFDRSQAELDGVTNLIVDWIMIKVGSDGQ